MKNLFLLPFLENTKIKARLKTAILLGIFFNICSAQVIPTAISSQNTYKEAPTCRAVLFNPNVYRSRVDITGLLVGKENANYVYKDTVVVKIDTNTKRFDYKIINEDLDGYVIIQILPSVKFIENNKVKYVVEKSYTETINIDGSKSYQEVKTIKKVDYKTYDIVFTTNGEVIPPDGFASDYYIAVKKDNFKPQSKILLSTKIVGIPLVHPFKFRTKTADVGDELSASFSVSYNFGIRLKLSKRDAFRQNFITFIPYGFGFGADKYFRHNLDGTTTSNDKKDAVSMTYYQGGILLTLRKVNFGVFAGFDKMFGDKSDWVYQENMWFSFGIGYKLGDF